MSLWEPAGWEHGGGKSAELSVFIEICYSKCKKDFPKEVPLCPIL